MSVCHCTCLKRESSAEPFYELNIFKIKEIKEKEIKEIKEKQKVQLYTMINNLFGGDLSARKLQLPIAVNTASLILCSNSKSEVM